MFLRLSTYIYNTNIQKHAMNGLPVVFDVSRPSRPPPRLSSPQRLFVCFGADELCCVMRYPADGVRAMEGHGRER